MGTIADKLQKLLDTKEAIRQAIIEKGQDVTDSDTFASYPEKIAAIQTGTDTSDATATAADLLSGKTAYGPRGKLTGAVAGVAQAAPVIAVSDGGLITASVTQDAGLLAPDSDNFAEIFGLNIGAGEFKEITFSLPGFKTAFSINNTTSLGDVATRLNRSLPDFGYTAAYNTVTGKLVITDKYGAVADFTVKDPNGTVLEPKYTAVKSATQQLATQGAATITPGTSAKTAVASGRYTTGAVTVAGDANLAAGNIRQGVSIFGVAGNYAGNPIPTWSFKIINNTPFYIGGQYTGIYQNALFLYGANMDAYATQTITVAVNGFVHLSVGGATNWTLPQGITALLNAKNGSVTNEIYEMLFSSNEPVVYSMTFTQ